MANSTKVEKVAGLKARIEGSQAMFLADFRGLTVADVMELRRSLRDSGTRVAVVKNTLMKRAAGDAGITDLDPMLEGPTAVAFVDGDPIAAARGLAEAVRRFRTLAVKGGFMDGRVLSAQDAQTLATIEPREVLLAKIAGAAKSQMARAAYAFQALQGRFLALLEAYREKVPGDAMAAEGAEAEATADELTAQAEAAAGELREDAEEGGIEPQPTDEAEPAEAATAEATEEAEPADEAEPGEAASAEATEEAEPTDGAEPAEAATADAPVEAEPAAEAEEVAEAPDEANEPEAAAEPAAEAEEVAEAPDEADEAAEGPADETDGSAETGEPQQEEEAAQAAGEEGKE